MPRGPSSKRQQGAANHHRNTQHENGLVGPGKRVSRRRSQTQLEPAARPVDQNGHALAPTPAGSALPSPLPQTNGSAKTIPEMANGHRHEIPRRDSLGAYSETLLPGCAADSTNLKGRTRGSETAAGEEEGANLASALS